MLFAHLVKSADTSLFYFSSCYCTINNIYITSKHIEILGCTTKGPKYEFAQKKKKRKVKCNWKNVAVYDGLTREQIREPKALTWKGEQLCKKSHDTIKFCSLCGYKCHSKRQKRPFMFCSYL